MNTLCLWDIYIYIYTRGSFKKFYDPPRKKNYRWTFVLVTISNSESCLNFCVGEAHSKVRRGGKIWNLGETQKFFTNLAYIYIYIYIYIYAHTIQITSISFTISSSSIKYCDQTRIMLGLVYGISVIVGYLMPNPHIYIYIYIYIFFFLSKRSKEVLLIFFVFLEISKMRNRMEINL